jgi:energy-coupling factor transporter ATP-binding protein EcfA2
MKITKITMTGFRGATASVDVTFDTSKRVTLIFGENGTGKSTIADAVDFLSNRSYGSLKDYSLGEPPRKYVASLGTNPSSVKVILTTSDSSTWTATLGKDGPVVRPDSGYPDARILRRRTILNFIEAQPKERFEELRAFIVVPNIEKAEAGLREAVLTTEKSFNECTRAFIQAKDSLEELWTKEGKPNSDAFAWAEAETSKDITQLQATIREIENIESAFQVAQTALEKLERARQAQETSKATLVEAEQKQQAAESHEKQQNAELLKLLQDATGYIDKRQPLTECPVCEKKIDVADLLRRLAERINQMQGLKTRVDVTTAAKQGVDAKASVANEAQKDFCSKVKDLGSLLKLSSLVEITGLNLKWDNFQVLLSNLEASETVAQQARDLFSKATCREPLGTRKEADQKSVNQHNAVKGHLDTLLGKQNQAVAQEALLRKLQTVHSIVSKERKDYVEGILASITGEVERLYGAVHPGEGTGKFRFYLKPHTIGSLEFDGHFQNVPDLPPQAYYSESHLDTLGICVFLALARFFKTNKTIVILDDVFTSVDAPHLERFMGLLHDEARHFMQFIVTTHYRPWRDRYRWAKGPVASTQLIELGPWNLQNGLNVGEFLSAIEELRSALSAEPFDRQAAASKAGIILESLLDFLTLKYSCRVPRNARNEYTLGDLAQGIDSKLGKELRSRKSLTMGTAKTESLLKPLLDSALGQHWVRNVVGSHFSSLGSEVTDGEVRQFCGDVLRLADLLICPCCGTLPTRRPSGSYWQCHCGDLELYPLIYPGAESRSVDDEA